MKKIYIILLALFLGISACQRSQFATTTRHSNNGKITFVKHYSAERIKFSKTKFPKNHLNETKVQNVASDSERTAVGKLPEPEIIKINPVPISEDLNLIASTSNGTDIIAVAEKRFIRDPGLILPDKSPSGFISGNSIADTIKKSKSEPEKTRVHFAKIKFKNGHEQTVKIIYQSGDTLKYQLIDKSKVVYTVTMDQVDTILPDTRKTEKLGLAGFILSILGLIPLIGIPFAILALIFGRKSLRKIKSFPEKYKGKGLAKAGTIIGLVGAITQIIYILIALVYFFAVLFFFGSAVSHCSGG